MDYWNVVIKQWSDSIEWMSAWNTHTLEQRGHGGRVGREWIKCIFSSLLLSNNWKSTKHKRETRRDMPIRSNSYFFEWKFPRSRSRISTRPHITFPSLLPTYSIYIFTAIIFRNIRFSVNCCCFICFRRKERERERDAELYMHEFTVKLRSSNKYWEMCSVCLDARYAIHTQMNLFFIN